MRPSRVIGIRKMFSIVEIMLNSIKSKTTPSKADMCIYEERMKCFQKLIEINKYLKKSDEEYATVSHIEGKSDENSWNRIKLYSEQYKKEYELCEKIMKY